MPATISKSFIVDEIRRTAVENGGKPPGSRRFESETGIKNADWCGVHWARWSDALLEAGFSPNERQGRYDTAALLKSYADFAKELGHLPARSELRLNRRRDPAFPHDTTYHRLGSKRELVQAVIEYCRMHSGYEDVLDYCLEFLRLEIDKPEVRTTNEHVSFGSVYLAKSGRYYKIGKSNAAGRREYEIGLQLPEKVKTVHVITTDDPTGIEAYWHKRFEAKRKNGEWFDLDRADVSAFKRRKFM